MTTPTPEAILRRIYDRYPTSTVIMGIPIEDFRAALGIKPPGPFPATYGGDDDAGYIKVRESAGSEQPPYLVFTPSGDDSIFLCRPTILKMWADLGTWLFGPPIHHILGMHETGSHVVAFHTPGGAPLELGPLAATIGHILAKQGAAE